MDSDLLIALTCETSAAINLNVDAIFQLWILTHISACYLLQNLKLHLKVCAFI